MANPINAQNCILQKEELIFKFLAYCHEDKPLINITNSIETVAWIPDVLLILYLPHPPKGPLAMY